MAKIQIKTPRWAVPLLKPSRYKAAWGGRGSGKSHFMAELLIEEHVLNPNQSSVCVREIQKSLNQSVKRLLEMKIQDLGVGEFFEVQDAVIKSRRGSGRIIFQGMQNHTADSIKSLEGYDRAWVEEAQNFSETSLSLLRPTIRKPASELWFTWNPRHHTDPVDQLLRGDKPPTDSTVIRVNHQDNPWFPEVLRDEMLYDRNRDPDKFLHVWEGDYIRNSQAAVFKNWTIEEFEADDDETFRLGADWGFAIDPTVLVRCFIRDRKLFIDYEAYEVGCEIDRTPELFLGVPDSEKWPIVADSARPETISYMQRNGFPKIRGAVKGAKSVEEGIEFLKSFDLIVHPRCVRTIDELMTYSYKTDQLTGEIVPILEDKHNHVIDALRYACESARRIAPKKQPDFTPLASAHRW